MNSITVNGAIEVTPQGCQINGKDLSFYDEVLMGTSAHFQFQSGGQMIGKASKTKFKPIPQFRGTDPSWAQQTFMNLNGVENLLIQNIEIDGSRYYDGGTYIHTGVYVRSGKNIKFQNCSIHDVGHSCVNVTGENISFENCEFYHASWPSFDIASVENSYVRNKLNELKTPFSRPVTQEFFDSLYGSGFTHGVYLSGDTNLNIDFKNCHFHDIQYGHAINVATRYNGDQGPTNINISGCKFENISGACLSLGKVRGASLTNFTSENCGRIIFLESVLGSENVLVQGGYANAIKGIVSARVPRTKNLQMLNNVFSNIQSTAFNVSGGSNMNIDSNVFYNVMSDSLFAVGGSMTGCSFNNNYILANNDNFVALISSAYNVSPQLSKKKASVSNIAVNANTFVGTSESSWAVVNNVECGANVSDKSCNTFEAPLTSSGGGYFRHHISLSDPAKRGNTLTAVFVYQNLDDQDYKNLYMGSVGVYNPQGQNDNQQNVVIESVHLANTWLKFGERALILLNIKINENAIPGTYSIMPNLHWELNDGSKKTQSPGQNQGEFEIVT